MRARRRTRNPTIVVMAVCLSLTLLPIAAVWSPPTADAQGPAPISGLHVVGNQIRNGAGQPVRLRGVNRSGTEYACIQGFGIFDGPSDAASIQAIVSWRANAVRIPLNEDCWLAINGVKPEYSGAAYQAAIASYVAALNAAGLVAILDLHWTAPGAQRATGQNPMPDRDHSVTFWSQVANAYKTNSSVIFELFNEPYPDNKQDTPAGWQCWRDGGTCPGVGYQAAGMQELVTAVRNTGATNVILLGGLRYSNALSQWLTYKPTDPTGNLGAAWHVYNFNLCNTVACYDATAGPVAQQVPLVATEIGEDDGGHGFIDPLMGWLDARGQSYLAWTWDTWGCSGPVLISNYNGTPCQTYGQGYKDHLAALSSDPGPNITPTPTITFTPIPAATGTVTPSTTPTATATATAATPTVAIPTAVVPPTPPGAGTPAVPPTPAGSGTPGVPCTHGVGGTCSAVGSVSGNWTRTGSGVFNFTAHASGARALVGRSPTIFIPTTANPAGEQFACSTTTRFEGATTTACNRATRGDVLQGATVTVHFPAAGSGFISATGIVTGANSASSPSLAAAPAQAPATAGVLLPLLPPPPVPFLPPPPPLRPAPPAPMRPAPPLAAAPVIPEADSLLLVGLGVAALGGLAGWRAIRRRASVHGKRSAPGAASLSAGEGLPRSATARAATRPASSRGSGASPRSRGG